MAIYDISGRRIDGELSESAKQSLLNGFTHNAWADNQGQTYYNNLYNAFYGSEVVSINAVFNQGTAKIYTTDSLNNLKQYLTVIATYTSGESYAVTDYSLSGTLSEGTSVITVEYMGKTATFNVNVTAAPTINILRNWDFTNSMTDSINGLVATTNASRDSNGVTFSDSNQYIDFNLPFAKERTYEIDVDYISTKVNQGTIYRRLFAFGENGTVTESNTAAFVFGWGGNNWKWYLGSGWDSTYVVENVAASHFDGKTVKIYINNSGKCYVAVKTIGASDSEYVNLLSSTGTIKSFTNAKVYIGGSGNDSLASARIKAFRVYEGEK